MVKSRYVGGDYLREVLHNPAALVAVAKKKLAEVDFDTVVGIGLSGVIGATLIGEAMGKNILLLRKDQGYHHSSTADEAEGTLGQRWIFVDDLISTGTTRADAIKRVREISAKYELGSVLVGTYLYNTNTWQSYDPNYLHSHWSYD